MEISSLHSCGLGRPRTDLEPSTEPELNFTRGDGKLPFRDDRYFRPSCVLSHHDPRTALRRVSRSGPYFGAARLWRLRWLSRRASVCVRLGCFVDQCSDDDERVECGSCSSCLCGYV